MTQPEPEERSPFERAFDDLLGYLDEQISEDMLQILLRTSFLDYAELMAPATYRVTMRLALMDLFAGELAAVEDRGQHPHEVERLRKTVGYKKIKEGLIRIRQGLSDPRTWIDSTQDKYLQNRAFGRQLKMALTSKNEAAVSKALDSMADRMAPAVRNQAPVLHITFDGDDLKLEEETAKMVTSRGKLIEGEVVS